MGSDPQKPCLLQQLPNSEPRHVKPDEPPQGPSVDILGSPQVPKAGWQPLPQKGAVDPQKPLRLQQLPSKLFWQVVFTPRMIPQLPSSLTTACWRPMSRKGSCGRWSSS